MSIVAKFRCIACTTFCTGQRVYKFVAAADGMNEAWASAAPQGSLKLVIDRLELPGFVPGRYYLLTLEALEYMPVNESPKGR